MGLCIINLHLCHYVFAAPYCHHMYAPDDGTCKDMSRIVMPTAGGEGNPLPDVPSVGVGDDSRCWVC